MNRKTIILVASYTAACFAVLGGFVYKNYLEAEAYKLQLSNQYQRAFTEFVSDVGEVDSSLQKTLYSGTPAMMSAVCTEVYGKASSAQLALGELPFSASDLEQTSGFLTKIGDYAFMLSKKTASGASCSDEEYQNLQTLSQTSGILTSNLSQLLSDVNTGSVSLSELSAGQMSAANGIASVSNSLGNSFKQIESEFPQVPALIYDGPFSTHISQMTPKYLEGKGNVGEEDAAMTAADFLGVKPDTISSDGERQGSLPVYMLSCRSGAGTISMEVTKQGGIVLDVFNSRAVSDANISENDAVKIAARFLDKHGFPSMKESYWMKEGNTVLVNFAYEQNSVICYTDLVKVSVALDDGSVVGFESLGYVMSHHTRDIPKASVTEKKAAASVSSHLSILSHDMAVIPTEGKNETFCHEFKCANSDGRHYIVYINAVTGAEAKVLILLESSNGTLAL